MEKKEINKSEQTHRELPIKRVEGRLYYVGKDGFVHSVLMVHGKKLGK